MRPLLLPALRRLWRDRSTLQLGVDPARAVLLAGVDARVVGLLDALDGTRTVEDLVAEQAVDGTEAAGLRETLDLLARAGAVVDAAQRTGLPSALGPEQRRRLRPALASLDLLGVDPGAALVRRHGQAVVVHDAGPLGTPVAALLGAAGIGRVQLVGRGTVEAADVAPGGVTAADEHRPRATAGAEAVRRCAPETDTGPLPAQRRPDLAVLAGRCALDPDLAAPLQERGVPHLPCWIRETTAIVGPLVVPGETACLRCADLHRADRDPAWPVLASQLVTGDSPPVGDPALSTVLAGLTALQALAFLDGADPEVREGSLELALPGSRIRRRSWPPHPRCGCRRPPLRSAS